MVINKWEQHSGKTTEGEDLGSLYTNISILTYEWNLICQHSGDSNVNQIQKLTIKETDKY